MSLVWNFTNPKSALFISMIFFNVFFPPTFPSPRFRRFLSSLFFSQSILVLICCIFFSICLQCVFYWNFRCPFSVTGRYSYTFELNCTFSIFSNFPSLKTFYFLSIKIPDFLDSKIPCSLIFLSVFVILISYSVLDRVQWLFHLQQANHGH